MDRLCSLFLHIKLLAVSNAAAADDDNNDGDDTVCSYTRLLQTIIYLPVRRPQRTYFFSGLRPKVLNNNIDMNLPW